MLDDKIKAFQELIAKREDIERQLEELFGGKAPERKQRLCGSCGSPGHTSATCQSRREGRPVMAIAAE